MKKFIVYLLVIVLAVSLGFAVFYLVRDNEVISISSASIYKDAGESFTLDVNHTNLKSYTKISISTSNEEIVSYESENNTFKAISGGVARINFRTTNVKFRNLWCDVIVGDGTVESPYYISTPEQLASIGSGVELSDENGVATGIYAGSTKFAESYKAYSSDKCYKLVENIDAKDINEGIWVPLKKFSGRFDGNGLTIKNINIDREKYNQIFAEASDFNPNLYSTTNVGIFQELTSSAIVYNFKLENVTASGIYDNFGIIAGINKGTIERIEIKSAYLSVETNICGGLVGQNITTESGENDSYKRHIARLDRCSVNMTLGKKKTFIDEEMQESILGITGIVGGLVGENIGGTIVYSYANGNVAFANDAINAITYGGLVGHNSFVKLTKTGREHTSVYQGGNLKDCYSNLAISFAETSCNTNSLFAGAIALNEDTTESLYENNSIKPIVKNYIIGVYYNKDALNATELEHIRNNFVGIAKFKFKDSIISSAFEDTKTIIYGLTAEGMKDQNNFISHYMSEIEFDEDGNSQGIIQSEVDWLFDSVWSINVDANNGLPFLNYQLIYIPNDFVTAGIPIVLNQTKYMFKKGEVVTQFNIISGANGKLSVDLEDEYTLKVSPSGLKLTWFSSNSSIVSVDNNGKIKALNIGVATITAKSTAGYTSTITIIVHDKTVTISNYPASISLVEDGTFAISGVTTNSSATISYESANNNIATVSSTGIVTGISEGNTFIYIIASDTKVSIPVNVKSKTLFKYINITLNMTNISKTYSGTSQIGILKVVSVNGISDTDQILSQFGSFTFTSTNNNIVKVDGLNNSLSTTYTIVGTGSCTIIVKPTLSTSYISNAYCLFNVNSDASDTEQTINISPKSSTLNIGDTKLFNTWGQNWTSNTKVYYSSSNSSIVSINENGIANAYKVGSVTITAYILTLQGNYAYAYAYVTVTDDTPLIISINPSNTTTLVGQELILTANVNEQITVSWSKYDPNDIATLTNIGNNQCKLILSNAGEIQVIAYYGSTTATATVKAVDTNEYSRYISTPAQLNAVRYHLDKDFIIINNLDMKGYTNWEPIGTYSNPFTGTIKGSTSAITIMGIKVSGDYLYGGLFGYAKNARIENISILDSTITGQNAGAILGQGDSTTILNCNAENVTVKATNSCGGLVGIASINSTINNSTISGQTNITGQSGNSSSARMVGGVVGKADNSLVIESKVNISGTIGLSSSVCGYVGGVVGYNRLGCISRSEVTANIMANNSDSDYAGGIVGYGAGNMDIASIKNSSISGYYAGGIGGAINIDVKVSLIFSDYKKGYRKSDIASSNYSTNVSLMAVQSGVIIKGNQVGGLFGVINSGVIQNCYTRATLFGNASNAVKGGFASQILASGFGNVGGVGNAGIVENCYSACTFSGSGKNYSITESLVHNYAGLNDGGNRSAGYCFNYVFDNDLDGRATYYSGSNIFKDYVEAKKSSSQMKSRNTYLDKNFSTTYWNLNLGYPTLVSEY